MQMTMEDKQMKASLKKQEEINDVAELAKREWISSRNGIHGILQTIKSNHMNATMMNEYHITDHSLKNTEKLALKLYSNDIDIKRFIIQCSQVYGEKDVDLQAYFLGINKGNGQLILCSYGKLPTGNNMFNKHVYSFNYFDIKINA